MKITPPKCSYIDSIGMYENIFPEGFCQHVIKEFDKFHERGYCGTRRDENALKYNKDDSFLFMTVNNHPEELENFNGFDLKFAIHEGLQACFDDYIEKFDMLKMVDLRSSIVKIQKTEPGQGYHLWHYEHEAHEPNRVLAWIIYLNDIDSAGETEFLYQKLRIPPKENTAIIWPAFYTHTHRGNVVHGNKSKYIITGWFNFEQTY
jgi:hypothetical protein